MKTIYRVLVLGILTMALTAVTATSLFAQDAACAEVEAKQAVYKTFTDNYASKDPEKIKLAIDAGEQYNTKYGSCAEDKAILDYLNKSLPGLKTKMATIIKARGEQDRYARFDTAIKAKNTADIFSVGKEILATDPELVDVMLVLATAGYEQATAKPPVDTYNGEAVNYARMAIQKLEAGTKSKTGDYGVLTYSYKDKDNALGWMNYTIGYIDYYRLTKKDEGLAYFYKASQINSTAKANPFLYQTIGASYREKVVKFGEDIAAKLKANNNQANDETKSLIAMQKGYADRAIDAYARAYKVADASASNKQYRDGLNDSVKEIYTLRFEGKTDGMDAYTASLISKPLPDPASNVTPVAEDPAPTTPGTTTPGTTTPAATPATGNTKPGTTTKPPAASDSKTPVKPMSSMSPKSDATKVTVTKGDDNSTSESNTKKPAPKKKGTR